MPLKNKTLLSFLNVLITLVNVFGFWGACFFVWVAILVTFPSQQQKQEFFDMFFLMKWGGNYICIILPCLVLFIVFFAQSRYYRNKYKNEIDTLHEEIERLVKERNILQEKAANTKFRSSGKRKEDNP